MPPASSKPEFLYTVTISGAPNSPSFGLSSFTVDATTGALSSTSNISLSQITPGIAVRPDSKALYLSNPSGNSIAIYSIDAKSGVPTLAGDLSVTRICAFCQPTNGPGELAMDPGGKTLYYGSGTLGAGLVQVIGALASDATSGMLSLVSGSPFLSDDQAPFFVLGHPSGHFLYTENINASVPPLSTALQGVSGYSINSSDGSLAPVAGSPFLPPANADVVGFTVHPSGKFLYASTGLAANGILAWSIDATTGALTALPGSPFQPGTATFSATFDPAGKFLYVSAGAAGGIQGFSVDASTGTLTAMSGSPFSPSTVLGAFVVDPTGQFLFASNSNDAITSFSLNATTGVLTQVSTLSVGARPGLIKLVQAP